MKCLLCKKKLKIHLTKTLRDGKGTVLFCPVCNLGILKDNRTQKELNKYYEKTYRKFHSPILNKVCKAEKLFDINLDYQFKRLELITSYLDKNQSLLEIGCSAGQFLYCVKPLVKEAYGVEPDTECISHVNNKIKCVCYNKLDYVLNKPKKFDVICAFQVLEHIKDPTKELENYTKLLKNNGYIFIEVPNLRDALLYLYNIPEYKKFYYHKAHLYYFTEKSLIKLMEKAGFKGHVIYVQDYNFLNHIHWLETGKPELTPIRGLSDPTKFIKFNKISNKEYAEMVLAFSNIENIYSYALKKLKITSNLFYIGRKR